MYQKEILDCAIKSLTVAINRLGRANNRHMVALRDDLTSQRTLYIELANALNANDGDEAADVLVDLEHSLSRDEAEMVVGR